MKKKFSVKWVGSKLPRKQRKYRANAPAHIRHKMMSVNLSKELRKKYGKRNFPLRKGDNIKIMRGEFKGKTGKIENVDFKKFRVSIGGINRTKKDGTKVGIYFNPSNLQIKELNLDDKKRIKAINRRLTEKKKKPEKELKQNKKEGKLRIIKLLKQGEKNAPKKK